MHRLPADVLDRIRNGFGVQWKTDKPFSKVSCDHGTEWVNGISKGDEGLSDITQTESATLRYRTLYFYGSLYFFYIFIIRISIERVLVFNLWLN